MASMCISASRDWWWQGISSKRMLPELLVKTLHISGPGLGSKAAGMEKKKKKQLIPTDIFGLLNSASVILTTLRPSTVSNTWTDTVYSKSTNVADRRRGSSVPLWLPTFSLTSCAFLQYLTKAKILHVWFVPSRWRKKNKKNPPKNRVKPASDLQGLTCGFCCWHRISLLLQWRKKHEKRY